MTKERQKRARLTITEFGGLLNADRRAQQRQHDHDAREARHHDQNRRRQHRMVTRPTICINRSVITPPPVKSSVKAWLFAACANASEGKKRRRENDATECDPA